MKELRDDIQPNKPLTTKRLCIVTSDIYGPIKNGGIGTAYFHLAVFLKRLGHQVSICFVNGQAANPEKMRVTRKFFGEYGISFHAVAPKTLAKTEMARMMAPPYAAYEWLKANEGDYDIVHLSEWHGLGYIALLAKSLGIAFSKIHFVVKGSSPTVWSAEGNNQFLKHNKQLGWVFMERKSAEMADTLICGSEHLLKWMRTSGYDLPERSFYWPNVFLDDLVAGSEPVAGLSDPPEVSEWVFFGRLEPRKGILLFVNAINELAKKGVPLPPITFLGGPSHRFDARSFIAQNSENWLVPVTFRSDFNALQAVDYLKQAGRLAVIPALLENSPIAVYECLGARIPFIAANTGGTGELIDPADANRVLFSPDHHELAKMLERYRKVLPRPAKKHPRLEQSLDVWRSWHGNLEIKQEEMPPARSLKPLVSVCLTHFERIGLLEQALEGIEAQYYENLEVIVVDDGSQNCDTLGKLKELEQRYSKFRFAYQKNRYVGAARNTAASLAHGDYLLFFDDDNAMMPNMVDALVKAASFAQLDCLTCSSLRFCGEGKPMTPEGPLGTQIRFMGPAKALSRTLNVVGDATCLVKRDVFRSTGGFSERYRTGKDDIEFFNKLILAGYKVSYYPDPLYYYRVGKGSMKERNQLEEEADFRQISPFLNGLDVEDKAIALLRPETGNKRGLKRKSKADYNLAKLTGTLRKLRRFIRAGI